MPKFRVRQQIIKDGDEIHKERFFVEVLDISFKSIISLKSGWRPIQEPGDLDSALSYAEQYNRLVTKNIIHRV